MKETTAIIVPAYNEAAWITETLRTLRHSKVLAGLQLVVVDDGSRDDTSLLAAPWADAVLRLPQNQGKGIALWRGIELSDCERFLLVDADLGTTAAYTALLLNDLESGTCEMTVACPPPAEQGGFGLVKRLAQRSIRQMTGITLQAPLSGQRALTRRAVKAVRDWNCGFGIEVAMTLDILRAGFPMREIPLPIRHREHGRSLGGFWHRGWQCVAIQKAVAGRREARR